MHSVSGFEAKIRDCDLEHADGWGTKVFLWCERSWARICEEVEALRIGWSQTSKNTWKIHNPKRKRGRETLLYDQKRQTKAAQKTNSINKGVICCAQNEWDAAHFQQMNLFCSPTFFFLSCSLFSLCSAGTPLIVFLLSHLFAYYLFSGPYECRALAGCQCFLSFHLLLQMQTAHSRRICALLGWYAHYKFKRIPFI